MRAFVTGGCGFIGNHLIDKLEDGKHKVYNYDLKNGEDIRDSEKLRMRVKEFKPDLIFHLAGVLGTSELMERVKIAEEVNVVGTINVLDVCKEEEVPMVFASKINPADWLNPYTITKRACEEYCKMYGEQWDVRICVMKILYTYGPRQKPYPVQKFMPTFVSRALKNEPLPIWGTGEQHLDPVFVKDVVEAMVRASENKCWGHTIEVGLGKGIPIVEVAKTVLRLAGSESRLEFLPMRPGEPLHSKGRLYADTRNMENLLHMLPKEMTSLEEGIKKTVDWWRSELK